MKRCDHDPGKLPGFFVFREVPMSSVRLSERARRTDDQPISYFMRQAVENPHLVSLAAGLVDQASLPAAETLAAFDEILADPALARAALQYGTTQGHLPLREKILAHYLALEGQSSRDTGLSVD